ncbi:MAG: phosphate ABC transporter substrate-binding protein PstS [Syntrophaceae bacterium]|nr:phosphate ABC transporter substrate-binding protein PstS [Syntrophaceae bacterium]
MNTRKACGFLLLLALFCLFPGNASGASVTLTGAGATFPLPFYLKVFDQYHLQTGAEIRYQGVGSGKGVQKLLAREVDFAGTDIASSREEGTSGDAFVRIPTCIGAVTIVYNLPGNPRLRFTAEVLADLFLGGIAVWNDPRIAALNPNVPLPGLPIQVIHRSDGSGTTDILSEYLSKASRAWREAMGAGKVLRWPVGRGTRGNAGVAGLVKEISGSVGYVELIYAMGNDMTFGQLANRSGRFVAPSMESIAMAAETAKHTNGNRSLTDTPASAGYPVVGYTWIVVFKDQSSRVGIQRKTAEELIRLLYWITHEGQRYAEELHYVPLPRAAVLQAEADLRKITFQGRPLLKRRR